MSNLQSPLTAIPTMYPGYFGQDSQQLGPSSRNRRRLVKPKPSTTLNVPEATKSTPKHYDDHIPTPVSSSSEAESNRHRSSRYRDSHGGSPITPSPDSFYGTPLNSPVPSSPLEPLAPVLFYHSHDPHYGFTNFSPHSVIYDGKEYPTSEHLFQSFKVNPGFSSFSAGDMFRASERCLL